MVWCKTDIWEKDGGLGALDMVARVDNLSLNFFLFLLGTSSGQYPSEPEKLVRGGLEPKVGTPLFLDLKMRTVGQFWIKYMAGLNSPGKSLLKQRMSI
jgi:hypothetical protein